MTDIIKPCPFCGSEVNIDSWQLKPRGVSVCRVICECEVGIEAQHYAPSEMEAQLKESVTAAWNKRAADEIGKTERKLIDLSIAYAKQRKIINALTSQINAIKAHCGDECKFYSFCSECEPARNIHDDRTKQKAEATRIKKAITRNANKLIEGKAND